MTTGPWPPPQRRQRRDLGLCKVCGQVIILPCDAVRDTEAWVHLNCWRGE